MKKYLIFILLISVIVFYQSSPISGHVVIRDVSPDFLLVAICLAAFILGPIPGQIIGFIVGLVIDIMSGGLLGISAFTFSIIGYGVGAIGQKVYGNNILITIAILFVVTLIKASILGMLAAIFLKPGYFGYFSQGKVFLEAVLNSLIAPILFIIITKIEGRVKR